MGRDEGRTAVSKVAVETEELFPFIYPVEQRIQRDGSRLYREIELSCEELAEWDRIRNAFEEWNDRVSNLYYGKSTIDKTKAEKEE